MACAGMRGKADYCCSFAFSGSILSSIDLLDKNASIMDALSAKLDQPTRNLNVVC